VGAAALSRGLSPRPRCAPALLRISRALLSEVRAHAAATFPEECCGFLLGEAAGDDRTVRAVVRAANTFAPPELRARHYAYDPLALVRAEEEQAARGFEHVGFYHSHPTGVARPSEYDRLHAGFAGQSYLIVAVTAKGPGEAASFALSADRTFKSEELLVLP